MPRRIVIDVDANIAGTQRVLSTLSNQLTALRHQADTISNIENRIAGKTLGQQAGTGFGDPRPYISQVQTSYQQFGNTVKQVATWVKELNGSLITGSTTTYGGSLDKIIAAQEAYRQQLERAAPIEDRAARDIARLTAQINGEALAYEHLEKAQYKVVKVGSALRVQDSQSGRFVKGSAIDLMDAQAIYNKAQGRIAKYDLPRYAAAVEAERLAPPPLPQNISQIARQSPDLLRRLVKGGIGNDTRGLYDSGAAQSLKVQEDLVRGVTRVTGAWTDQNGALKRINAEYDRAGNLTTTFGGRLRGVGSAITQTGRDILKMSEWAVAAVAVYGAFNKIGQSIGTILTIDKGLHQLGITANLTTAQTHTLFKQLADVGIETATPLTEIVGAADNIALAVRRVGDSSEQTQAKIVSFARSVGILTNLSGIDTVKATDLLTSAYKQLGITVDQIPSLLDKVTAVAGGQSNAIADVITAVAQLGEAAKVGNLSIADLVGTVQVLSQVTAKTPAEVATSLKNLIGSLGSPAALKALKAYNIDIKDTHGNLKSLLDIYGEISTKFATGAIPEGQQQALIRAISGGPRRAPDAAALLGSYNQIANSVRIASNASNEHIIANLKVLDSAQAKLVQLQATFDKFAVGKFGDIIKNSVGNLAELLSKVLDIFDKLDPHVYEFIGTLAIIAIASKGLGFIFGNIAGLGVRIAENFGLMNRQAVQSTRTFVDMSRAADKAANSIYKASVAGTTAGPASAATRGGFLGGLGNFVGRNRSSLVPIAAGVATGAVLDAATGASPKEFIQNLLLGGGLAALTVPEPTGITKIIAAVGLLGGGLLALIPEEHKVKEATGATTEELLQSVTAYQQASDQIRAIAADNNNLGASIDNLLKKQREQKLSEQDSQSLAGYQDTYAKNTIKAIDAKTQLQTSFNELRDNIENLPGLSDSERATLKIKIRAAIDGQLDPDSLKELTAKITEQFLKTADPKKYGNIGNFTFRVPILLDVDATHSAETIRASIQKGLDQSLNGGQPLPTTLNPYTNPVLAQQIENAAKKAGQTPQQFIGEYNKNLAAIQQQKVALDALLDPANKYKLILDQITIDQQALATQGLLHLISADDVDQGSKLLGFLSNIVTLRQTFNPQRPQGFSDDTQASGGGLTVDNQINQANKDLAISTGIVFKTIANGFKISEEDAISLGNAWLRMAGRLSDVGNKGAAIQAVKDKFKELGIIVQWTNDQIATTNDELNKLSVQNIKDIRAGFVSEYVSLINQRNSAEAKLQGDRLGPATTKDQITQKNARIAADIEELNQINALISGNARLRISMLALNKVDPEAFVQFKKDLASIHGLEALAFADTKDLNGAILGIANTFGLSGKQVDIFVATLIKLITTLQTINGLKTTLTLEQDVITRYVTIGEGPVQGALHSGIAETNVLIAQKDAEIKKLEDQIAAILKSGKGSGFGQVPTGGGAGGSKGPGLNVSSLDVTDEIYKSQSRQALIDEAIRRARAVQSKIPGEDKKASNDIVALLHGTEFLQNVKGVKEEYLRKAIEELTAVEKKRLEFDTKADQIRRIRVGSGDFAAIANVPFNSTSGISVGNPNNITININGAGLTPAQYAAFADKIASEIKRSIASG